MTTNVFSPFDFGAVGDNVADDTAAIQAAISAAQDVATYYGGRGGELYVPGGFCFRTTAPLRFTKPIKVRFGSFINYTPTTGDAVVIGAPGWQQYYDMEFAGVINTTGNPGYPTGVNAGGTNGVRILAMTFSSLRVERIEGFTNAGVYLDGTGTTFSPQVIQHDRLDFYQIVKCGVGIYARSVDAATSSVEANYCHTSDCYQNFIDFVLDNQGGEHATTSNRWLFDAIDDSNPSGQGGIVNGQFNLIDVTYLGCNIWFGPTSAHNTLNVYNTAATDAKYTPGGTNNHYNVAT